MTYTIFHSTDLWSTSDATPTTINSSNFGVGLKVQFQDGGCESYPCSIKAQVDHIRITVFYTAPQDMRMVHTDHLGGTNVVTNASGTIVQTIDYYPYGSPRIKSGSDVSQREYIGQYYDETAALNYLNARYYEGSRGQFLSQDPSFLAIGDPNQVRQNTGKDQQSYLTDPQQLNSYNYGRDNPITQKDPTGRIAGVDDLAGLGVGGLVGAGIYLASLPASQESFSWGNFGGSVVAGGIIGWGAVNTPETLGVSNAVSASILTGLMGGFYGNLTEQGIDIATQKQKGEVDYKEAQLSGLVTAGTNGVLQVVVPNAKIAGFSSRRGNMNAIRQSMDAKFTNNTIHTMSFSTAVKSAVGSQAADAYRTIINGLIGIVQSLQSLVNNKK